MPQPVDAGSGEQVLVQRDYVTLYDDDLRDPLWSATGWNSLSWESRTGSIAFGATYGSARPRLRSSPTTTSRFFAHSL
ncbi:MAG: hypothetical protein ACRED5_07110, partial [Propylenella sp.]